MALIRVLFAFLFTFVSLTANAWAANPTGPTQVVITAAPVSPGVFGTSVTFTATVTLVSNGSAVTSGTVKLMEGATQIGSTGTVDASGKTTFTTSTLTVGTHSLVANYTDPGAAHNSSGSASFVVTQPALLAVTASPNPASPGATMTFSARVTSPATGAAITSGAGHIKIFDNNGGATLAAALPVDTTGQATFAISTLSVGVHPITLLYSDASTFTSEVDLNVTVSTGTSTALSTSGSPSTFHNSVTLTATVTSSGGTPTGQVNFVEGGSTIGSTSLNGSGLGAFTTTALGGGTHSITAAYVGFGSFNASTSSAVTQVVNTASTTTAVTTPAATVVGSNAAVTATVSSSAGTPGGTVTFADGVSTLANVSLAAGSATLNTTQLGAGSHTITASYPGSTNFSASNVLTGAFNIGAATTTTTLNASPASAALGATVTLTATVAASSGPAPTGTVTFSEGATTIATAPLNGGQAVASVTTLATGGHSIVATYGGSTNDGTSVSSASSVTIGAATTTTALTVSPSPANVGGTVTLTAVVLPSGGATPTGTVAFSDGATSLGSASVDVSGHASVTVSNFSIGTHSLSATYTGSGGVSDQGSTGTASLTVAQAASTTVVTSSQNPQTLGQNVTFTATVSSGGVQPTGSVAFADGPTPLGSVGLSGGIAQKSTSALSTGSHTITATYSGDTNNTVSTGSLAQSIGTGVSATVLTLSRSSAAPSQQVTLTATVTGASPTLSVTFKDGATPIGSAGISGGTAQLTTSFSAGSHALTATYGGDANNTTSTSSSKTLSVAIVASSTSLTASPNTVVAGSGVTFHASVTSSAGSPPSGSINFLDGGSSIGSPSLDSNGNASFTTSSLAAGSHTLTASYGGNSQNASSVSLALPYNVTTGATPDFALSTTVAGATMSAGQNTTIPLALQGTTGFSGNVTITCAGLPQGATCVSSPPTVSVNSSTATNVTILLTTTGSHSGSVTPLMHAIRRAALPLAGVFALFTFFRRRSRRSAIIASFLALGVLAACGGGGGGGGTLPGVGSGNGFGNVGPALPTPTPAAGTPGTTPGPGGPSPSIADGTGDIVAGTGQVGAVSTGTLPSGVVLPNAIAPGTIVQGTLTPGTSSAPAGQTPAGTSTVALVATGANGVAHPLNVTITVTP
jgi:hypothetical protein